MTSINSFLQDCKEAKYKHSIHQDVAAYSVQQTNLDDIVNAEFEKESIIPDPGSRNPSSKISHLSIPLQKRLEGIFKKHPNLFSRSKHHLGKFVGFKAVGISTATIKSNVDKLHVTECYQLHVKLIY
jgi:alkaline phosphatase